jgi:flavorubredoxin
MDAYKDWTSENTKNEVIIPYTSMHGSTQRMVDIWWIALIERGVKVKPLNLTYTDMGEVALGSCGCHNNGYCFTNSFNRPTSKCVYATYLANALRPKLKFVSVMGSYGWGGRMLDQITGMISTLKVDMISPLIIKGFPKEEDYKKIDEMADEIASKHKKLGIIENK